QILSDPIPCQQGLSSRLLGRSDVSNLSAFSRRSPNRSRSTPIKSVESQFELNSGTPKSTPLGVILLWLGAAGAAEVLSQNRYGSAATRRTLLIG
ncbi:hypothetical protein, partial [Streptomyces azureus]|uniref:hypothetical protein n=1 Tax=Streptomyces azureus TaxID=146537 RepID=UPI001F1C3145